MRLCSTGFVLAAIAFGACAFDTAQRPTAPGNLNQQLFAAAQMGNSASIRQLLAQGADVNARDQNGRTPLIVASVYPDTVRLLLDAGANLQARDNSGETALVSAARSHAPAGVAALLKKDQETEDKNSALFAAMEDQPAIIVVSEPGSAARQPKPEWRPPPEPYVEVVKLLLDSGAGLEARNDDGATPLIWAAEFGANNAVRLLLTKGADVDEADHQGNTALMWASCECASIDMPETLESVNALLEKRANPEIRNGEGKTALMLAAGWGRAENAGALLDHDADIEATDDDGDTALLIAAQGGGYPTADAVKLLLDRGADVEARDNISDTPLLRAAAGKGFDEIETLKLLLAHRANVHAQNAYGETALSLARKSGRGDAIRLLESASAAAAAPR